MIGTEFSFRIKKLSWLTIFFLEGGKNNKISCIRDGRERVLFWNKVHCCCWGVKCVYSLCFQNNLPPQPHLLYIPTKTYFPKICLSFSHIWAGWMDGWIHICWPLLFSSAYAFKPAWRIYAQTHTHTHTEMYICGSYHLHMCIFRSSVC